MEVIVSESKACNRMYLFGHQRPFEWGSGLQEKIRLLFAVRESLKDLVYFKGIRP